MSNRVHQIYLQLEPKPKELLDNPRRVFIKEGPVILWNEIERKKKDRVRSSALSCVCCVLCVVCVCVCCELAFVRRFVCTKCTSFCAIVLYDVLQRPRWCCLHDMLVAQRRCLGVHDPIFLRRHAPLCARRTE